MGRTHKTLLYRMKYNDFLILRKSICVIIWAVNWTQHLIHEIYFFFFERRNDTVWLFRLGYLADIFSKTSEVSLSLWEKQLSDANDTIKILRRKFKSWRILSTTMGLTASKYLKTFLMKLVVILINVTLCQYLEDLYN